jgi:hypothetical protein
VFDPFGSCGSLSTTSWSILATGLVCLRGCLDIGSSDIMRGLGRVRDPMSTVSTTAILQSQDVVAAIDVGRVNVARIKYDIVPLSN